MKVLSKYKESKILQDKGSPYHINCQEETVFYVRRITDQLKSKLVELKRIKYGVFYDESELSEKQQQESFMLWFAEFVICGWDNLYDDEDGKKLPYSLEASKKIFNDYSLYNSIMQKIYEHAANYENYLESKLKEDKRFVKKQ